MTTALTGKVLFIAARNTHQQQGRLTTQTRGSWYYFHAYRARQRQPAMQTSMSRKGHCHDNAPMGSLCGALRNESLSPLPL